MSDPAGAPESFVGPGQEDRRDVRFAIVLPDGWLVLDLDPATRDRAVDRLVKGAIGGGDRMARYRREAAIAFRRLVHAAAEDGAFFAATYSTRIDDLPLAASVLAFLVPLPLGDDGRPIVVEEVATRLATAEGEDLHETPAVVDLPVGRGARVRARASAGVAGSNGEEPPVDAVRFYVPVPAWGLLFVLAFSTPSLPAADAFADLFDLLARTARWKTP